MQCCKVWHDVLNVAMELGLISDDACASSAVRMECIESKDALLGFGFGI